MLFRKLSKDYRRVIARHNLDYTALPVASDSVPVTSIVIPCTGADYIVESVLSATFAARYANEIEEIVIVTDQSPDAFPPLPDKTRIARLDINVPNKTHKYGQIYKSRLLKIMAPLQAATKGVLMIDSDLNLLKMPDYRVSDGNLYSCFRAGRMGAKFEKKGYTNVPFYYKSSIRPGLEMHVNSAFLAGTYFAFQRLCPLWRDFFNDTWEMIPDDQPPTDQPPLSVALDTLDYQTINLGDWTNWPVSKKIGDIPSVIPKEVIGAHGGFPLSEWEKYLQNPDSTLLFRGQDYTRKVRYLSDAEKK